MSTVDPLSCSILSSKVDFDVVDGENTKNTRQDHWKQNMMNI